MKKFFCIFALLLALSMLGNFAAASDAESDLYLSDDAKLLSSSENLQVKLQLLEVGRQYNIAIHIKTTDSLENKAAQDYADDYYDDHMLHLCSGNGVLLIVAMNEREWAVTTNGQTHKVITNSDIDEIMDDVLPDLSDGNYYEAFSAFAAGVQREYDRYESGVEDGKLSPIQIILISLGIGAVVGGIAILVMRSSMKTARPQRSAVSYIKEGTYRLTQHGDFYLYSTTSRTPKPKNNSSGGGGGSRGGRSGSF